MIGKIKKMFYCTSVDTSHFRWTDRSQCIGGCGANAQCKSGICICKFEECKYKVYLFTSSNLHRIASILSSNLCVLQRTCKPMGNVIGTKQPPFLVTMRNTENRNHLHGLIGASAKTRTATRRSVTTLEMTRPALSPPIPMSLITTLSFASKC